MGRFDCSNAQATRPIIPLMARSQYASRQAAGGTAARAGAPRTGLGVRGSPPAAERRKVSRQCDTRILSQEAILFCKLDYKPKERSQK